MFDLWSEDLSYELYYLFENSSYLLSSTTCKLNHKAYGMRIYLDVAFLVNIIFEYNKSYKVNTTGYIKNCTIYIIKFK